MSDNPCRDLPDPIEPGEGETPPPVVEEIELEGSQFPRLGLPDPREGMGAPTARSSTILPRNLYIEEPSVIYFEGGFLPPGAPRDPAGPPSILIDQDGDPVDTLRYQLGKVHSLNAEMNENFFQNPASLLRWNELSRYYFRTFASNTETNFPNAKEFRNELMIRIRLEDVDKYHVYGYGQENYEELFDKIIPHGAVFRDNSFRAPASFFEREARALDVSFREQTSMQVFVPNLGAYSETLAPEADVPIDRRTELHKQSLYHRYASEYYDIRPSQDVTKITTHKFPASKIAQINEITTAATQLEVDGLYSSFSTIFSEEYDMYSRIKFNMDHHSPIAEKLIELELDASILGFLDQGSPSDEEMLYTQILDQEYTGPEIIGRDSGDNDRVSLNYRPRAYEDFNEFFRENLGSALLGELSPEQRDFLEGALHKDSFPLSFDSSQRFETQKQQNHEAIRGFNLQQGLASILFEAHVDTTMQSRDRDFRSVLANKLCHSEVIAYRMEKIEVATGQPIQNFYFFNSQNTDSLDFVDTQIVFGKKYKYRIYTINFVLGCKYEYSPGSYDSGNRDGNAVAEARVSVHQTRTVDIIESPYFEQELFVSDAPPLTPHVFPQPVETNAGQSFMWWFAPAIGEEVSDPIALSREDFPAIRKMRESQGLDPLGTDQITYKSDTDPTHYQMFTLEEPPLSYLDFDSADLDETTILANYFLKTDIVNNKDYYIVFRAKDISGFSNPTRVTKFTINKHGDEAPYVTYDDYDFETQLQSQRLEMTTNGAISVTPAMDQSAINFSNANNYRGIDPNSVEFVQTSRGTAGLTLGFRPPEESIWNKKFCIELVSKTTGKKMRFMLTYSQLVLSSVDVGDSDIDMSDQLRDEQETQNRRLPTTGQRGQGLDGFLEGQNPPVIPGLQRQDSTLPPVQRPSEDIDFDRNRENRPRIPPRLPPRLPRGGQGY